MKMDIVKNSCRMNLRFNFIHYREKIVITTVFGVVVIIIIIFVLRILYSLAFGYQLK